MKHRYNFGSMIHKALRKTYAAYFKKNFDDVEGLCAGFNAVFLNRYFTSNSYVADFIKLLTFVLIKSQDVGKMVQSIEAVRQKVKYQGISALTVNDRFWLDTAALIEQIEIYQNPDNHRQLLNQYRYPSYPAINKVLTPQKKRVNSVADMIVACRQAELESLLNELKRLLDVQPENIVISIGGGSHEVSLLFDGQQCQTPWSLVDSNHLYFPLRWQSSKEAVKTIFEAFHCNTGAVFALHVLSREPTPSMTKEFEVIGRRHNPVKKLDYSTSIGVTPIHLATLCQLEDKVKRFIALGGDVNKPAEFNISPLHLACSRGFANICRLLLENGADAYARQEGGATPLICAAEEGHTEVVNLLLAIDIDIDAQSCSGCTALLLACLKGHTETARVLIHAGAVVDLSNGNGSTPLLAASQNGNIELVRLLIEEGASIDKALNSGATPLYLACRNGHKDVVAELLRRGAYVDVISCARGQSLMELAKASGHTQVVALLEQHQQKSRQQLAYQCRTEARFFSTKGVFAASQAAEVGFNACQRAY